MMRAALTVSAVVALLLVLIWGLQRRLMYLPSATVVPPRDGANTGPII